jgi:hypothetical protein
MNMTNIEIEVVQAFRQKMDLLQQVRAHMEDKTVLLMTNQLDSLERGLQIDAELQEAISGEEKRLEECRRRIAVHWDLEIDELDWVTLSRRLPKQGAIEVENIRRAISQIVEDIHYINLKNLALLKSGQMYVETLLNAIWPSPTYEREKRGSFAPPSRFSMEC